MANVKLSNIANVVGDYESVPTTLTSEAVITELIAGLTIVKKADKQNWASGNLTYTVTITNNADSPYEKPVFTDTLDPTIITLVENSVRVNDAVTEYNYNSTTGLLTVQLDTIANTEEVTVTFQVQKV